jgi:ABC-type proline/glycine betaine transport system substrate-binding protein
MAVPVIERRGHQAVNGDGATAERFMRAGRAYDAIDRGVLVDAIDAHAENALLAALDQTATSSPPPARLVTGVPIRRETHQGQIRRWCIRLVKLPAGEPVKLPQGAPGRTNSRRHERDPCRFSEMALYVGGSSRTLEPLDEGTNRRSTEHQRITVIARTCVAVSLWARNDNFEAQLEEFLPNIIEGNERGRELLQQLRACIEELDALEADLRDAIDSELEDSMLEKFKNAGERVGRLTLRAELSQLVESSGEMNKLIQSRRESRRILGPAARKTMSQLSEAEELDSELEDRIKDICDLCDAAVRLIEIQKDPALGPIGRIGWYVPSYVVDQNPSLSTWEGFADPGAADLFATPATAPNGQFLGADPSFVQFDADIIRNLGLDFEVVFAGSEQAIIDAVENAVEREEPLLFYFWTPHPLHARVDLTRVDLPPHSEACYATADAGGVDCDYPPDQLFKILRPGLSQDAPDADQFLRNFNYRTEDQVEMIAAVEVGGKTPEQAACDWIEANETVWQEWIP